MKKIFSCLFLFFNLHFNLFAQVNFINTNLALVEINVNGQNIPQGQRINGTMQITFAGGTQLNSPTDAPNIYNGNISIGVRGASSSGYPQKSYNFTTIDANGDDLNLSILGMPAEHDWVLITNWNDKSFARNLLAQHLFTQMGHYGVRFRLAEVLLDNNYIGIYLLGEKIKRDRNRVNIASLDPTDNTGVAVTGGYIIKNDLYDGTNGWQSNYQPIGLSNYPVYPLYEYPNAANISIPQRAYIQAYIDSMETNLYSVNYDHPTNGYGAFIDNRSFIDYFIINELARSVDGFKKSSYFHKKRSDVSNKLYAGPVWDFDWAFKTIYDCSEFENTDGSGWSHRIVDCPGTESFGWYKRLVQDSNFNNQTHCRWQELRQTILDTTYLFNFINQVANQVNNAQVRHFTQYPELGQNNGAPEVDAIPSTYQGEVDKLKNWLLIRILWLDDNLFGQCINPPTSTNQYLNSPEQSAIQISPNPNPNNFYANHLIINEPIQIYNFIGQLVHTQIATQTYQQFSLFLPKGIYIFKQQQQQISFIVE